MLQWRQVRKVGGTECVTSSVDVFSELVARGREASASNDLGEDVDIPSTDLSQKPDRWLAPNASVAPGS